jgi:site-specific recombinase XerD
MIGIMKKKDLQMSFEEMISSFLTLKKVQHLRERTLKDYKSHLTKLAYIYDKTKNYKSSAMEYLASEKINPTTYNTRLRVMKVFFNFCLEEGLIEESPLKGLKQQKAHNRIVEISDSDIIELLKTPNKSTYAGLRDYALLLFSIDTASRPLESLQLKPEDFSFGTCQVTIPEHINKTKNKRTLNYSAQTYSAIKKLLSAQSPDWKDAPVFSSEKGTIMLETSWAHCLAKYCKKIGIKNVSPYMLRHYSALSHLKNDMNLFALSKMMGHTAINTTQIYLNITTEELTKEHDKASVINKLVPLRTRVRKIA